MPKKDTDNEKFLKHQAQTAADGLWGNTSDPLWQVQGTDLPLVTLRSPDRSTVEQRYNQICGVLSHGNPHTVFELEVSPGVPAPIEVEPAPPPEQDLKK